MSLTTGKTLKGKLGDLLEKYADQARLSRKLAMIESWVPLDINLEQYR